MAGMNQSTGGMFSPDTGDDLTQFQPATTPGGTWVAIAGPSDNEGATTYEFETSGEVVAGQVDDFEEVNGGAATGKVGGGTDRFFITGALEALRLGGSKEAAVKVGGERVDPASLPANAPPTGSPQEPTPSDGGPGPAEQIVTAGGGVSVAVAVAVWAVFAAALTGVFR